jgi:hypothetical protein
VKEDSDWKPVFSVWSHSKGSIQGALLLPDPRSIPETGTRHSFIFRASLSNLPFRKSRVSVWSRLGIELACLSGFRISPFKLKAYAPYIEDLRRLLLDRRLETAFPQMAEQAVNGEASLKLANLVSAYALKRTGAFFSGADLSERAAARITNIVKAPALLITDPACGAGNLLLAAAKKLPVKRGLTATLQLWGQHLAGFDIHAEFIRAAHLRLALLALTLGAEFDLATPLPLARLFPKIRRGDGLRELASLETVTHVLINPPFGSVTAPRNCSWAKGKVTKAAVFFERCLKGLRPNTHLAAILPDVLRAGSRYHRWREAIEKRCAVLRAAPVGNFETADVDVFLLEIRIHDESPSKNRHGRWWTNARSKDNVGERFDVHVGAVVPHRLEKNEGPSYPYLHAKDLPFWGVSMAADEEVAFAGKTVRPPFVAVRRTSSPSDRYRALGTIICGSKSIAVENHLLVCIPKSGGFAACKRLLEVLKRGATNAFLNRRIRCRHLTVGVVKEIPW